MTQTDQTKLIVVGIDGSVASSAALRWAMQEGVSRGATVEVVHSWHPQIMADIVLSPPHELHVASLAMLTNEVSAASANMPDLPPVVQTSLRGTPPKILLDRAAHAELLVLGAHGKSSVRDLVFGKIAATCIKEAGCPVAIVDSDDKVVFHGTDRAQAPRRP